jgi:hypothetical protein
MQNFSDTIFNTPLAGYIGYNILTIYLSIHIEINKDSVQSAYGYVK